MWSPLDQIPYLRGDRPVAPFFFAPVVSINSVSQCPESPSEEGHP